MFSLRVVNLLVTTGFGRLVTDTSSLFQEVAERYWFERLDQRLPRLQRNRSRIDQGSILVTETSQVTLVLLSTVVVLIHEYFVISCII